MLISPGQQQIQNQNEKEESGLIRKGAPLSVFAFPKAE
jgi:hypothetical protein